MSCLANGYDCLLICPLGQCSTGNVLNNILIYQHSTHSLSLSCHRDFFCWLVVLLTPLFTTHASWLRRKDMINITLEALLWFMRLIRVSKYRANNKFYSMGRNRFNKSLYSFHPLKIIKLNTFTLPPSHSPHVDMCVCSSQLVKKIDRRTATLTYPVINKSREKGWWVANGLLNNFPILNTSPANEQRER